MDHMPLREMSPFYTANNAIPPWYFCVVFSQNIQKFLNQDAFSV